MSESTRAAAHAAVRLACKPSQLSFHRALRRVKETQLNILSSTLKRLKDTESSRKHQLTSTTTFEQFQQLVPITDYSYWQDFIERQKAGERHLLNLEQCNRYQPTSGSTSKVKWIPYSPAFLKEIDHAVGPWISDLYTRFPGGRNGRHFWSISWVPTALRQQIAGNLNDDSKLLPWWKSVFMGLTMAVPQNVAQANSSESSIFATLSYLAAAQDLSFISVWSPTFALNFFEQLAHWRLEIAKSIASGKWHSDWQRELNFLSCPKSPHNAALLKSWDGSLDAAFFKELWPELSLVSSWATSSSKSWAKKLHELLPHAAFQGKGLMATEGVITFPYGDLYPLAITSHFYEFRDLSTQMILAAWQLEKGQEVQPILTTANGLLRYALKDRLRVTAKINDCPCFEFLGRLEGIDLVGEKMSPEIALSALSFLEQETGARAVTLLAISGQAGSKSRYIALMEGANKSDVTAFSHHKLEAFLLDNFHYRLARDLEQLASALVLISPDASSIYFSLGRAKGMIIGNMKIEPLVLWDRPLSPELMQLNSKPFLTEKTTLVPSHFEPIDLHS